MWPLHVAKIDKYNVARLSKIFHLAVLIRNIIVIFLSSILHNNKTVFVINKPMQIQKSSSNG